MVFLLSIVLGVMTYGVLEFIAIQFVGGRCFSIPFGGTRCGSQDWPWLLSILFWAVLWRLCIYMYTKRKEKNKKSKDCLD